MVFWGGSYSRDLELNKSRRVVQLDQSTMAVNERNKGTELMPKFKFKVIAGAPLRSK
jgi:hypothetical protein